MATRFTLHGFKRSGPSYKIGLALTLANEPFDYVSVNLMEGQQKTSDYLKLNRYGQVPALVDNSNGRALCQSGAILDYLADKLEKFGGATLDERLRAREWILWGWDRFDAPVYRLRGAKLGFRQMSADTIAMYEAERQGALDVLEAHFASGHHWLAGQGPTIADIDLYGVADFLDESGYEVKADSHVGKWMARMQALPHFKPHTDLLPAESRTA